MLVELCPLRHYCPTEDFLIQFIEFMRCLEAARRLESPLKATGDTNIAANQPKFSEVGSSSRAGLHNIATIEAYHTCFFLRV